MSLFVSFCVTSDTRGLFCINTIITGFLDLMILCDKKRITKKVGGVSKIRGKTAKASVMKEF